MIHSISNGKAVPFVYIDTRRAFRLKFFHCTFVVGLFFLRSQLARMKSPAECHKVREFIRKIKYERALNGPLMATAHGMLAVSNEHRCFIGMRILREIRAGNILFSGINALASHQCTWWSAARCRWSAKMHCVIWVGPIQCRSNYSIRFGSTIGVVGASQSIRQIITHA